MHKIVCTYSYNPLIDNRGDGALSFPPQSQAELLLPCYRDLFVCYNTSFTSH